MPGTLATSEREYAAWLGDVERHVILPLKWIFLAFSIVYWMWTRDWAPPGSYVFGLFVFFIGATVGEHYFFARDRITPRQVRPFVFGSFLLDAVFVTLLVILDCIEIREVPGPLIISDYFIFYVLLILRGFALFRTKVENFAGFAVATILFILAARFQMQRVTIGNYQGAIQPLVLVWALMLFTQAFIGLVNEQKEEQVRAAERLVRSSSLASLGELTAGVAHEINNPIGIIKTYVDFLEKSVGVDDPMREDFETIRGEAERCEQIVRQMLDFSNPQIQGFLSVDLRDLCEEVAGLVFHESQEANISAEVVANGSIPPVKGDPVQLRQALLNILVNARQIIAQHQEEQNGEGSAPGRVRVALSRSSGPRPPVRIEVWDNGPGISPEDIERVFEPFFTRRKKGTGFGLAITRRIIEAHNGTIRIAPHPEAGTIVTIEIPIEGEEQA